MIWQFWREGPSIMFEQKIVRREDFRWGLTWDTLSTWMETRARECIISNNFCVRWNKTNTFQAQTPLIYWRHIVFKWLVPIFFIYMGWDPLFDPDLIYLEGEQLFFPKQCEKMKVYNSLGIDHLFSAFQGNCVDVTVLVNCFPGSSTAVCIPCSTSLWAYMVHEQLVMLHLYE